MTEFVFNLKSYQADTGLSNLTRQTKRTDDSLNTSMLEKVVKSDDIICIQFENPQISYRLI